ncbi:adenylate cyclase [Paucimonas lemoignei]|uniref:Adenylate cyclase n=1 Tax=Paucimonas lemoignei TaxID=29443 RepID=A0A4R3HW98_PAULE|nr:adenylate/guanylate cyclase domain-containing protein [Paucimonas lemoignei]TCS37556.1 adenylate cyclase [Paucimonas lemoignei]
MVFRKRVIRLHITISLIFVILTMPVIITFVVANYRANLKLSAQQSERFIQKTQADIVNMTTRLFNPMLATVRTGATLMRDQPDYFRRESSADYLNEILALNEAVYAAYVSFADGSFRQVRREVADFRIFGETSPPGTMLVSRFLDASARPAIDTYVFHAEWDRRLAQRRGPASYDPRQRSFYRDAVRLGGASISDPYLFASSGELGVTVSAPVRDKGQTLGVVAADFTLKTLSQYLSDNRVSPHGMTIIADASGGIVAHPAFDQVLMKKDSELAQNRLDRLDDPRVGAALAERLRTRQDRFTFYAGANNTEYLGIFSPFPRDFNKDWELLIIVPTDDFVGDIKRINRQLVGFGLLALLLQIFLIYRLSRSISRPIERLADEVAHIREFRFDRIRPVESRVQEIKYLSEAIDLLARGLESFTAYVPKGLVQQLIKSGHGTQLGVQSRYLTTFFTDIENFSSLAEVEPSQQLLARVSEYFAIFTEAVEQAHGTVDKFIGDAVMAFWGAPVGMDDHAYWACVAAVRARRRMAAKNREWEAQGLAPLKVRIGIHADAILVGNIGSEERVSYTVMGDGVNVASRLEGINKELGTWTCVSHNVYREAGERLWLRPIDAVLVKGRKSELVVYELLAIRDADAELAASEDDMALCRMTTAAYADYAQGNVEQAAQAYAAILARFPDDPVAQRMLEKCRARAAKRLA